MDISNFQRKAVLLIFISILVGSILLARKEPLKTIQAPQQRQFLSTPQITPIPTRIDINTADISMIMQLPGIGPGLAKEIINHRPYSKTQDLLNVPGIGEKRLSRIKEMIDLPEDVPDVRGPASHIYPIDINKATVEQLSTIPGIGEKIAQSIIDYREKIGRFNNLEELMNVPRIGEKTYENIKEYLYVENLFEVAPRTNPMAEDGPRPSTQIYDSRINPKVKCPYCGKELWEKGKRKKEYIRCPHCLKLLT